MYLARRYGQCELVLGLLHVDLDLGLIRASSQAELANDTLGATGSCAALWNIAPWPCET